MYHNVVDYTSVILLLDVNLPFLGKSKSKFMELQLIDVSSVTLYPTTEPKMQPSHETVKTFCIG